MMSPCRSEARMAATSEFMARWSVGAGSPRSSSTLFRRSLGPTSGGWQGPQGPGCSPSGECRGVAGWNPEPICYYHRRRNSVRSSFPREYRMASTDIGLDLGRYKLGWSDQEDYVFKPKRGLTEDIVNEMSWMKGEPNW